MARQRLAGRKKWFWRVIALALPLLTLSVVMMRLRTWRPRPALKIKGQSITWVAWMPDGQHLAVLSTKPNSTALSSDTDSTSSLSVWRVSDAKELWSRSKVSLPCAMMNDGRIVTQGDHLQIFNAKGVLLDRSRSANPVCAIGDHWMVTGGTKHPLTLWDLDAPRKSPHILGSIKNRFQAVALSADGEMLATVSSISAPSGGRKRRDYAALKVWDFQTRSLLRHSLLDSPKNIKLTFSSDHQLLALFNPSLTVRSTLAMSGSQPMWYGSIGYAEHVQFSPDGKWIAASNFDSVVVYNAHTGALKRTLPTDLEAVSPPDGNTASDSRISASALAFSPDSATLAVGDTRGTVTLWRMK